MKFKLIINRSMLKTCFDHAFTYTFCYALTRNNNGGVATQNDVEPRPNQTKSWRNNGGVATQYDAEPIKRYHQD